MRYSSSEKMYRQIGLEIKEIYPYLQWEVDEIINSLEGNKWSIARTDNFALAISQFLKHGVQISKYNMKTCKHPLIVMYDRKQLRALLYQHQYRSYYQLQNNEFDIRLPRDLRFYLKSAARRMQLKIALRKLDRENVCILCDILPMEIICEILLYV